MASNSQTENVQFEFLQTYGQYIDSYQIEDELQNAIYGLQHLTLKHLLPASQGTLSAHLTLDLPGNAVVEDCKLRITAARADRAQAATIAELRAEEASGANTLQIIVDFGTVRTVSAALLTLSGRISKVEAWNGTEFPMPPAVPPFEDRRTVPDSERPDLRVARFRSDVRTERLRITIVSTISQAELLGDLHVILPDSPKDLAISINGGPPVWTLPGPAAIGPDATLSTQDWNTANERLVDVTAALRALTGDPLDTTSRTFDFELTSREAGVLKIDLHVLDTSMIRRASFNGSARTKVAFDAEGITLLPLTAPDTPPEAKAKKITFRAAGEFPPERRIPAAGPDPRMLDGGTDPLVQLDITPSRGVIMRLAAVNGLPSLTGLRLPLRAGSDGAELRLVPWSNAGEGRIQPDAPLDDLAGDPVTLDAGSAAVWTSAFFAEDLELDPANLPWVAIVLARGSVSIALSDGIGAPIRFGPPSGPWRDMPALFSSAEFSALRLPYRSIGDAEKPQLTAPLLFDVPGTPIVAQPLDPIPAGAPLSLEPGAVQNPALRITHFTAGTLDIDEVDIVFDT